MQQPNFCWHVHHEMLVEWCYDHDGRVEYIRTDKSPREQGLRLRLFRPVKGQLPQEVFGAGKACMEAREARDKARKAYDKAAKAYDKAMSLTTLFKVWKKKAHDEAKKVYHEAQRAYFEAWDANDKAGMAYSEVLSNHKDEVEALHKQECPDCPWNGRTIFSAALAAV